MDKSGRMQIKALISWLGLLLIIILLVAEVVAVLMGGHIGNVPKPHVPVVQQYENIWILEADAAGMTIFRDGVEENYTYGSKAGRLVDGTLLGEQFKPPEGIREQIADIELTDGSVTDVRVKTEKISGRILSVNETTVEVDGYGKLQLASDYKGYRIYNSLAMCLARDLPIGYDFADFVMENGAICGILLARDGAMENIRVLIKSADYGGTYHNMINFTCDTDFVIQYGSQDGLMQEKHVAGEPISLTCDSGYFTADRVTVIPSAHTGKIILENVTRSHGIPEYRGTMEFLRTDNGMVAVNQVPLEEYLYCVVPSEMPASYPAEALKAQAICARTYAYGHMQNAGYPQYGAHVDDSTSYQVYNNIREQAGTTTAVKETYGQLLYTDKGNLAETFYYSTSCGVGSNATVWKTQEAANIDYISAKNISNSGGQAVSFESNEAFSAFIGGKDLTHFEATEGWYRWTYHVPEINVERMVSVLQKRYEANPKLVLTLVGEAYMEQPVETFSMVQDMYISKRGAGGIADEMIIVADDVTYKVISEHNIRYILNDGITKVWRQDGSEVSAPTLLPSAFINLSVATQAESVVGYTLAGGGFGHGVGMSQNAAKHMAKQGYTAENILLFFYDNCVIKSVYS